MLHTDISTADARRLLSRSEFHGVDPDNRRDWDRRRFLKTAAFGLAGAGVATSADALGVIELIPDSLREAWGAPPVGPNEGILVHVLLYGGNDGLSTVVPYTDDTYYQIRGELAVAADTVRQIDGTVGFAPQLEFLDSLYKQGEVAILQSVGYGRPDFSHFTSMAIWMRANARPGPPQDGWIGRWLDGLDSFDAFRGCSIGTTVPLHLIGRQRRATGIPDNKDAFGGATEAWERRLYNGLREFANSSGGRGAWHDATAAVVRTQLDVVRAVKPVLSQGELPESELVRKMTLAARLINANLGLRVLDLGAGDFDVHEDQLTRQPVLLADLDAAIKAFYDNLDPTWRGRVTILTSSEFGRTPYGNGSKGTDHGAANNQFVIGAAVKGGRRGVQPTLAGLGRWDDLPAKIDFRSVYATVLDEWMGGGGTEVTGTSSRIAGLFASGPSA